MPLLPASFPPRPRAPTMTPPGGKSSPAAALASSAASAWASSSIAALDLPILPALAAAFLVPTVFRGIFSSDSYKDPGYSGNWVYQDLEEQRPLFLQPVLDDSLSNIGG